MKSYWVVKQVRCPSGDPDPNGDYQSDDGYSHPKLARARHWPTRGEAELFIEQKEARHPYCYQAIEIETD